MTAPAATIADAQKQLEQTLAAARRDGRYRDLQIFDAEMRPIFPAQAAPDNPEEEVALRTTLATGHRAVVDVHPMTKDGYEFGISYPVLSDAQSGE